MRNALRLCAFVLASSLLTPAPISADALTASIPADAKAVVMIDDLRQFATNAQAYVESAGLPAPVPLGIIDAASEQLGLADVWQPEKGLALIFLQLDASGLVVALPISDEEKAMAAIGADATDRAFATTLGVFSLSAMVKDGVLLLAPGAKVLASFGDPARTIDDEWTESQRELRAESAVYFAIHRSAWAEDDAAVVNSIDQFASTLADLQRRALRLQGAVDMDAGPNILEEAQPAIGLVLAQIAAVDGALRIDANRVRVDARMRFVEESQLGQVLASRTPNETTPLQSLPAGRFVFAGGCDTSAVRPFLSGVTGWVLGLPGVLDMIDAADHKQVIQDATGFAAGLDGLDTVIGFGPRGVLALGRYRVEDPAAAKAQWRGLRPIAEAKLRLITPFESADDFAERKVDDLEVDELAFRFDSLPADGRKLMRAMFGGDLLMQSAVIDDTLGFALSPRSNAIGLLAGPETLVEEGRVRASLDELPEQPVAVALVDPIGLMRSLQHLALTFSEGVAPQFEAPDPATPLVGFGVGVDGSIIAGRLIVHASSLRALFDALKPILPGGP